MGKGLTTGKTFLSGVLSKIQDPEQRAAAERLLENETFVTEIGNGVEGQAEIDRQLQLARTQQEALEAQQRELTQREAGLDAWHADLTAWHERNKTALAAAAQRPSGTPAATPPAPPTEGLTDAKLGETLQQERAAFLGFQRDQNQITRDHFAKFGEILDLEPLLRNPQISTLGLIGTYELVHKERLTKFQEEQQRKHDETVAADAVRKFQETQAQMPYLSPTGVGSGSPLDALAPAKEPLVDAATAHYNRLLAERHGAAAGAAR